MFKRIALAALALSAVPSLSIAQVAKEAGAKATLAPGMPAPALTVAKWVKGTPVASFEKGKVYVVEFWATWCPPCVAQMPHLSAMQREYRDKGVTFIGLTSEDKSNSLSAVESMVADKGDGMDYTVAWDTARTTNEAFMKAAGQGGIPCSFLIDKQGLVAYIGHPMFLDEPLAEVVAGTWDLDTDLPALQKTIDQFRNLGKNAKADPTGTLATMATFEKEHPKLAHLVAEMKFDVLFTTGDYEGAYKVGSGVVDHAIASKNSMSLNMVAWTIVDPETTVAKRDLDLALRAAKAAVELTGEKDGGILDTLARVYAWKGDFKKALELQTRAVEVAPDKQKAQLRPALEEYKAKNAQ